MKTSIAFILIGVIVVAVFGSYLAFEGELLTEDSENEHIIVTENSVVVSSLDKELIGQRIEQGKNFLLEMEHENLHGFYRFYYPFEDRFGRELVTAYSASIVYTLLYYNNYFRENESILRKLPEWVGFITSMQNLEKDSRAFGAFHDSYNLFVQAKENTFGVGTSALSIFTLLELYEQTDNLQYLKSARMAGDWLIAMQNPDGSMTSSVRRGPDGEWSSDNLESLLYQGQVLSSLSRLYGITDEEKYYKAASKIAGSFLEKYERAEGYIRGDYRDENPISNSWVVMSLIDFYRASGNERCKKVILELSGLVLQDQIEDKWDSRNFGRWSGTIYTSGNGWMTEVMTETYRFCLEEGEENCEKYRESVVKGVRWLIQYTYSEEHRNLSDISERAVGSLVRSMKKSEVRTDSVCHALNSYIRIWDYLEDGILISIPGDD